MRTLCLSIALLASSAAAAQMVEPPPAWSPSPSPTVDLSKFSDAQIGKFSKMCDPTVVVRGIKIPRLPPNSTLCLQVKARAPRG
jgi:hypothetical protein